MAEINISNDLNNISQGVRDINSELDKTPKQLPLKAELKALKQEMTDLLAQGITPADKAFQDLAKRAGQIQDNIADANAQVKIFADDARGLTGALNLIGTASAGFGLVTGSMKAFGVESESLTSTISALGASMTVLNSVKQLEISLTDRASASYAVFNGVISPLKEGYNSLISLVTGKTVSTQAETTATEGAIVAETAHSAALKVLKGALVATGIGAIVVLLGTLIANWDKATAALQNFIGVNTSYKNTNDEVKKSIDEVNHETDNQIKIMKAQGASESEIIALKKQNIKAQIEAVKGKIADIEAQNAQIRSNNKWYKAISGTITAALKGFSALGQAVLYIFDKIFDTNWTSAFNKMIEGAGKKVADWALGVSGANDEVVKLKETLKGLQQTSKDLDVDAKVASIGKASKTTTKQVKETKQAVDDVTKSINAQIDAIKRKNKSEEESLSISNRLYKISDEYDPEEAYQRELDVIDKKISDYERLKQTYLTYANDTTLAEEDRLKYQQAAEDIDAQITEQRMSRLELEHEHKMDLIAKEKEAEDERQRQRAKDEADALAKTKETQQKRVKIIQQSVSAISNILGNLGDYFIDEAKQEYEAGKITEEEARKKFEVGKKMLIAETIINTSAGASMAMARAISDLGFPVGPIVGGATAAAMTISGLLNLAKIKSTTFDGGGSLDSGSNTSVMASAAVTPVLDESRDVLQYTTTPVETSGDKRVYILQQDISDSQRQVQIRENNTTF